MNIFDILSEFLFCLWARARPHAALLLYHLALRPLRLTHWRAISTSSNSTSEIKQKNKLQYLFKAAPFLLPQLCGCDKKLGKYNIFVLDWPLIAVVYHRARCEFQNVVLSVAVSLIIRCGITLVLLVSRMKNAELTQNNCYKLRGSGSLVTIEALKMIQRGGSYGTEP